MTALLLQIRVPTLLLAPARSSFTPLPEQVKVRDTIPDARIAVIDGRGHEIDVDEPEACTAALLKFLRSLEVSGELRVMTCSSIVFAISSYPNDRRNVKNAVMHSSGSSTYTS